MELRGTTGRGPDGGVLVAEQLAQHIDVPAALDRPSRTPAHLGVRDVHRARRRTSASAWVRAMRRAVA
jgi:hypothetical protein